MKRPKGLPTSSGIYSITNDLNGKIYVGQSVNIRAHAGHHKYLLSRGKHYNPPLQASYNKHGALSFTFAVIQLCDVVLLTLREQFYMDAAGTNKFNTKPAGASGSLGIPQPASQKLKHSRSKGGRPFFAWDSTSGDVLRFEHVGEAVVALPGLQRAHVYSCLHGTRYSHAGFEFDYDPAFPAVAPKHHAGRAPGADERSREVIATDEQGVEVSFEYISAVKLAGYSLSAVYDCLAGRKPHYRGCTWRYADGRPHVSHAAHNKGARRHGGSRPVIGLNPVTGASVRFEYINLAAKTLGVFPQNISSSIRNVALGKPHTSAGFLWSYEKNEAP